MSPPPSDGAARAPARSNPGSTAPWRLYRESQRWAFVSILFVVTTANYLDYFVIAVLLEPIKHEFGVSDTLLGLLSGPCFALVYAAAALPISRWADRGNRRTVIALAIAGWSVMTAACGLARSFLQLAISRFGVGIFEPGAMPPAQSLVADYFPPERRATATTILAGGASAVGWLVGVGLGGLVAATYGWRAAFILAGAPGLLLAAVVRWTLAEPRCQLGFPGADPHAESFGQSLGCLLRKRSFLFALAGLSIYEIFAFGVTIFVPSFMIRSLHTTLAAVSMPWAIAISVANIVGAVIGGRIADRLNSQDVRWCAWLPAAACIISLPLYWLALFLSSIWTFVIVEFAAELVLSIGIPVTFALVLMISGRQRRSTANAILYCSMILVGASLGPFLTGVLSDLFHSASGEDSLRYALLSMCAFLVPAGAAYYKSGRLMPNDLED